MGEFPLLKELNAKHKEQGLAIIGISLDDDGNGEYNRGDNRDAQEPAGKNGAAHRHDQDGTCGDPEQG